MPKTLIEQNLEKIDKAMDKKDQRRLKALMQNLTQNIKNESATGISEEVRQKITSLVSGLELEAIVHFPTIVSDLESIKTELGLSLTWMDRVNEKIMNDPLLSALFIVKKGMDDNAYIDRLNQLGYGIKSKSDLVKMVNNSIIETLGKIISEENTLDASAIMMNMENEDQLEALKTKIEKELAKTIPMAVVPTAIPPVVPKISPKEPAALVHASLSTVAVTPVVPPKIPKISETEEIKLAAKNGEVKEGKKVKNLEKMALENAPKEFREWTMLFNALHHRNLPEDAEKAIKAKKNREICLGVSDEKTFLQLRNVLEKGTLRKFINARDRIKAMEAISGVENLDENNIGKNLAEVIGGIKLKIVEAKQAITKPSEALREGHPKASGVVSAGKEAEKISENKKPFGKNDFIKLLRASSQRFSESDDFKKLGEGDLNEVLGEMRKMIGVLESRLGKPIKNPQTNAEKVPQKPTLKELAALIESNESLQPIIQELEDIRQLMAKRAHLLKFAIKPKGFRDPGAFKKTVEMLESNDDPLIKAETKEGLLMAYMKIILEWSPHLFESWSPETSNEKIVNHFKKMGNDLLAKIRQ